MATLKGIIDEVILEKKNDALKVFYEIDVFIQEYKNTDDEDTEQEEQPAQNQQDTVEPTQEPEEPAEESFDEEGNLLTEEIFKKKLEGETSIEKKDAERIQTVQDLVDYLSDEKIETKNASIIQKILKGKEAQKERIISPVIKEVILLMTGIGGDESVKDIVNKNDKVIVQIEYGYSKEDSIGLRINKKAGTEVYSIFLIKDGKILNGPFNQQLMNERLLYYRNSLM
ncbi:MAG: hypothetical protein ACOC3Z_00830 [Nanoarchaeota archaeon]